MDIGSATPSMSDPHLPGLALAARPGVLGARALAGVALLVLAVPAAGAGRVLLVPAGLWLLGLALRDLLLRPVLSADGSGLTVVDGLSRRHLPWSEVVALRVVRDRRTPLLEIDLGSTVVVLSGHRLGMDPEAALHGLEQVRPVSG